MLGGFHLALDGRSVHPADWRRISAIRLIKLLLVTSGHAVARETAAEQLWPEADPEHQATNLRKAVHFARRALAGGTDGSAILASEQSRIGLDPDADLDLDLDRLQAAIGVLTDRTRHDRGRIATATETVLSIGAEELLPDDPYEEWLTGLRERLASQWRDTAIELAGQRLAAADAGSARPLLERILLRDPSDEDAHRLMIELLGLLGQHHAARRQFFRCRQELAALGIEPSSETVQALGSAEAAAVTLTGMSRAVQAELVGRQAELTRLERTFDRIAGGRSATLVLRGPAGIGKSRLLEEVARYGRASGWQVLEARAAESTPGLSFAPIGVALAGALRRETVAGWPEPAASAAATLVPSLGMEPMLPFKQPRALAAAVADLISRLVADGPVALLVDDGHWLDDGSADLLTEIAQGTVDLPLLLAFSLRTDEPRSAAVDRLVDSMVAADGAESLELGPLRARDIPALVVRHLGGVRVDPRLATVLTDHSGGNPLFCLELARDARDRGRIAVENGTWRHRGSMDDSAVPQGVARLVAGRCRRLRSECVQILSLSAEIGEVIDHRLVSRASGEDSEAVISALDDAMQASLVVEAGGSYRFAHPLYRAALQRQTGPARRGRLMLSLARALAGGADPTDVGAVQAALAAGVDPVAVADRALRAVAHGIDEARPLGVAFGFAAATRQVALFDRPGARRMLDQTLEAWASMPPPERAAYDASTAWRLRGEILLAQGAEKAAEADYREAIATARDAFERGAAYHALTWVPYRHGDYESTIAILDEAVARHADDELLRGILMMDAGWLKFRHQRLPEAVAQLEAAEAILSRSGSDRLRMQVLDCLWGPLESLGRGDETTEGLHEALAIAIRLADVIWEQRVRTHLGFRLVVGGTPGRARPHLELALLQGAMIGDFYMEAVAAWASAEMAFALGDDDAAEGYRRRELELLSGLGGNARNEAMAHVHLAHILRRSGRPAAASDEAALARARSAEASVTDPDFGRRVDAYLDAERWVPMSQ